MIKQVDQKKQYAAHYIQLGSAYARLAMLSFDEKLGIQLAPFDREYPSTIFLSGTILIHSKGEEATEVGKLNKISIEEMQDLLNKTPNSWAVKLP